MAKIAAKNFPNWQYGGSTAELRIYANQTFQPKTGDAVIEGSYPNEDWFKRILCTVNNETLTVPEIELPATTDSDTRDVEYTAVLLDADGNKRPFYVDIFKVPHSLTETTWNLIRYNTQSYPLAKSPEFWDTHQVELALGETVAFTTAEVTNNLLPQFAALANIATGEFSGFGTFSTE